MRFYLVFAGIIFFAILRLSPIPSNLNFDSWLVLSLMILMTFWWVTHAIPLSVTALLPLFLVPIFSEIQISSISNSYTNPIIFLLLGGFIIAQGFEKSGLHKRLALKILNKIGNSKKNILLGFVISTAFLSMWLSNTATCLLMLPLCLSVLEKISDPKNQMFDKILLVSVAYSSSIGGMSTLIGTAPNALMAGYLSENYNINISFVKWMLFSLPLVIFLLFLYWFSASKLIGDNKKIKKKIFKSESQEIGPITVEEKITLIIIIVTALLWILRPLINNSFDSSISDASIAILGATLFFIIPVKNFNSFILEKNWFKEIPWDILLLFGGGLALASLVTSSGLANWISNSMNFLNAFQVFFIILFIALIISFLTEVTSNTATTLLFLPILSSFALNNNIEVVHAVLPLVFASSCAFMMPIATPPNAIVFSTNKFSIQFMIKIGFFMNVFAVLISSMWIFLFSSFLVKF